MPTPSPPGPPSPLPPAAPPPVVEEEEIPLEEQIPSPFGLAIETGDTKIRRNQNLWRGNSFSKVTDGIKKDLT